MSRLSIYSDICRQKKNNQLQLNEENSVQLERVHKAALKGLYSARAHAKTNKYL
jgi:hypothetical protein